eukprot:533074_1
MDAPMFFSNNNLFNPSGYVSQQNEKKQPTTLRPLLMVQQSSTLLCEESPINAVFEKNNCYNKYQKPFQIINERNYKCANQFKKEWNRGKQIGWGGQASVFEVTPKQKQRSSFNISNIINSNSLKYVAKIIYFMDEDLFESIHDRKDALYSVINEYKFVQRAELLNYIDLYIDKRNYTKAIIIMEKLSHSLSSIRDSFNIQKIAKDLAYNIKEIHDLHYAHLDLKKENVMWNTLNMKWSIIDYGFAKYIDPKIGYSKHNGFIGSKSWTAPEIVLCETSNNILDNYSIISKKCDIYSYGLILLNIIVGGNHYIKIMDNGNNCSEISEMEVLNIFCSKYGNEMIHKYLLKLSKNGIIKWSLYIFLSQILKYSPNERPNIDQILDMDYLKNSELINI